jgi:hypothetical protein
MPVDKGPWTSETLALLGTMPDSELAKRVGCIKQAVSMERRMRGIKAWKSNGTRSYAWGTTELGLLCNYSDEEVAKITGRSMAEIVAKRKAL